MTDTSASSSSSCCPMASFAGAASSLTRRQKLTLVAFALAQVAQAMCVSLQAPFFPKEAEETKGATSTECGLVFGVFELVVFVACPIIGPRLARMGATRAYHAGIFITGTCCVVFGQLDRVADRGWFIGLSSAVRALEAVGNSLFLTSSFSIVAETFPENFSCTFALMEAFFGLGLIVGPAAGSALYQAGGYRVPFAALGGVLIFIAAATLLILPRIGEAAACRSPKGVGAALRIPVVALSTFSGVMASASIGFMLTALEPHLRQFRLSPIDVGWLFVLNGGCYSVSTPLWGCLVDYASAPPLAVNTVGAVLILGGFTALGPAPFFPQPQPEASWDLILISLVMHGVGIGAVLVSSFTLSQKGATRCGGFPDDLQTKGMVSGLWAGAFALGAFVGPIVVGAVVDLAGVRWATQVVAVAAAVHLVLVVAFVLCGRNEGAAAAACPTLDGYQVIEDEDCDVDDDQANADQESSAKNYCSLGTTSGEDHRCSEIY